MRPWWAHAAQQCKMRVNRASHSKKILTKRIRLAKRIMSKKDLDKKGKAGKTHRRIMRNRARMSKTVLLNRVGLLSVRCLRAGPLLR